MAAENGKQIAPAYIAYSSLVSFINWLRETHIPPQIDRTVMPKASGSQVSATVGSLKFLKMLDANSKPLPLMRQLVSATDEDRPKVLKTVLEGAYPFLFTDSEFSLETATGQMMAEKFRVQGVSGATLSKAVSFFLAAAKVAGIKVSQLIKPPPVTTGAKRIVRKRSGSVDTEDYAPDDDEADNANLDVQKFQIPIPGKPNAIFIIPKDLSQDEWAMLKTMLDAYVALLQKQQGI